MSSVDSDMLIELAEIYSLITIDAACAATGAKPNTAVKALARLTEIGKLVKRTYIHPRCYWHPRRPLGAQGLILASSVLYRCLLAEKRIWTPELREGSATLITCNGEREALF